MINSKLWLAFVRNLADRPLTDDEKLSYESKRRTADVRQTLLYLHQWLIQWQKDNPDPHRPDELPGVGISEGVEVYFEAGPNWIEMQDWIDMRDPFSEGKKGKLKLSWEGYVDTYAISDTWVKIAHERGHPKAIDWIWTWVCKHT